MGKPQSRIFLGFTFGKMPRVAVYTSKKAMKRARRRIQELTNFRRQNGNLERTCERVGEFLRGWLQYYGRGDSVTDAQAIFGYARRRLRLVAWQNWRVASKRRRALLACGIPEHKAKPVSQSSLGAWRVSCSPVLHQALPNKHFHQYGFPKTLNGTPL